MKYLIKENFKAIRSGEFVVANTDEDEFIFDTENAESFTIATLQEIAKANGMKEVSKTKAGWIENLSAYLDNMGLPKVNKMTDTQKVEEIVAAGIAADKSDDEMLVDIVNAGISFKTAGKLFKSVMEAGGHRISAADRTEKAKSIIADADFFNPVDEDGDDAELTTEHVKSMIETLVSEIPDTSEKQALVAIRKAAKEAEVDLPKVKKGGKGGGGASGITKKLSAWMLENKDCTAEEIAAKIQELKPEMTEGQLKKYVSLCSQMVEFGRAFAA